MLREHIMITQQNRQIRLIASLALAVIFAVYLGSTAHANDTTSHNLAAVSKVNGSINIRSNEHTGNVSTVNGSVRMQQGARADRLKTVNGGIHLDDRVQVVDATTVNGNINVGRHAAVAGNLHTVNGAIRLEADSRTGGNVNTVNGLIQLTGAEVTGDLTTVNGNVLLRPGSVVGGDIVIRKNHSREGVASRLLWPLRNNRQSRNRIDIGADTIVRGDIHLYREVELNIDQAANVGQVFHHY